MKILAGITTKNVHQLQPAAYRGGDHPIFQLASIPEVGIQTENRIERQLDTWGIQLKDLASI